MVWRKHLALLIYLALSPRLERSRDHLLGLLWPEKPESQSRHSLNEAVRRLRAGLGADRLRTRGDALALNPDSLCVDATRFGELAGDRAEDAVALLKGDFLEGFHVEDAPGFEEWSTLERNRCRAAAAAAWVSAGERRLSAGRLMEAADAGRRSLAFAPLGEPGVRLVMRAAAIGGDATGALATYHDFARRLAEETGEAPSRELQALAERLRAGRWRPAAAAEAAAAPPLLGRDAAHASAFAVVKRAIGSPGRPSVLVIAGDPGMGRSRLAAECGTRVALDGGIVCQASLLASDHDATWSTLRAILGGASGLLRAPGAVGADPNSLKTLAGISTDDPTGSWVRRDHGEVAAAFSALCAGIAEEQPLAIIVDDAHLADGASLDVLGAALARLSALPVLLVVTCLNASDQGPKELTRLRGEVGRRLQGDSVRLDPLAAADLHGLVGAFAPWCGEEDQRARLTRRLAFETGGSPFLAVSLLESLRRASTLREDVLAWPKPGVTIDGPLPITIPNLARMGVIARVSDLAAGDVTVLRTASVLGLAVDPSLVSRVAELPEDQVDEALGRLERARLLAFDGARFIFAAPLIADVVARECLLPGERRLLRQRGATVLAERDDLESRVLRAELLARVQPDRETLSLAATVGLAAMATGALRTARRSLAAAERAGSALGGAEDPQVAELRRRIHLAG